MLSAAAQGPKAQQVTRHQFICRRGGFLPFTRVGPCNCSLGTGKVYKQGGSAASTFILKNKDKM